MFEIAPDIAVMTLEGIDQRDESGVVIGIVAETVGEDDLICRRRSTAACAL